MPEREAAAEWRQQTNPPTSETEYQRIVRLPLTEFTAGRHSAFEHLTTSSNTNPCRPSLYAIGFVIVTNDVLREITGVIGFLKAPLAIARAPSQGRRHGFESGGTILRAEGAKKFFLDPPPTFWPWGGDKILLSQPNSFVCS